MTNSGSFLITPAHGAVGSPEEARSLLDPVLERMMEAVHRYEGTVNQVMGDGIMALFAERKWFFSRTSTGTLDHSLLP